MKPKTVFIVAMAVACIGDVVAQQRSMLMGEVPKSRRVIQSVESELKDVWTEPEEDFKLLLERAMKDDPQALYALSQVCKAKGMDYAVWHKYLDRAAELGYVKAQLRLAMLEGVRSAVMSADRLNDRIAKLQKAKRYCSNAIAAGYLCVTNLIPIIDKAIERNEVAASEESRRKDEREQMERELRMAEARQNGITTPLIPFVHADRIEYADAIERAKKNDPEAFYWLAYYFLKGYGVRKDANAAARFLQKSADLGYAKACYLTGIYHEKYSLDDVTRNNVADELSNVLREADIFLLPLKIPESPQNISDGDYTNDVASAYVLGMYSAAVRGGLPYATNDIARLKRKIVKWRERAKWREHIASEQELGESNIDNGKKALALLGVDEHEEQHDVWSSWPATLDAEDVKTLFAEAEVKFNCVFLLRDYFYKKYITHVNTTNTWTSSVGKPLIMIHNDWFYKVDGDGLVVACGMIESAGQLPEFKWYLEERARRLGMLQVKWAKEHGMTLDEAVRGHKNWQSSRLRALPQQQRPIRSPLLGKPWLRRAKESRQVKERR